MTELWRILSDARVTIAAALVAVVVSGFALAGLAYRSVAAMGLVAAQLPYAVSGGAIALGLIGGGLRLLAIHVDRVEAAQERQEIADLRRRALEIYKASL